MKTITSFIFNNDNLYFLNKKNEIKIVDNIQNEIQILLDHEIEILNNIENNYIFSGLIIEDLKDFCNINNEQNLLKI